MKSLLSTTYFGPVQWYQKLYRSDKCEIEQWESFQKQTYRNRCLIATTNGTQSLTVPVEHHNSQFMRDIRISDHGNWRHLHWNALQSAYGESPFFEYYQDTLRPFFDRPQGGSSAGILRHDFLLDFNEAIRSKICDLIDIQPQVNLTHDFVAEPQDGVTDFRTSIAPKHPADDPDFSPKTYYQVYQQKHGFLSNLSILDLLFNMGPESVFYL